MTIERSLKLSAAGLAVLMALGLGCGDKKPDPNDPGSKQNALKMMPGVGGGGGGATGNVPNPNATSASGGPKPGSLGTAAKE